MKQQYLLDSRTLLAHLCGKKKVTRFLKNLQEGEAVITHQSRSELLAACSEDIQEEVLLLLDHYPCIASTQSAADQAAELKRSRSWPLSDATQVALALEQQLCYVSTPHPHFKTKNKDNILILS
jgi:predicted nucleic acid-binding protein